MTLARVSSDGQITVPTEIRRALKIRPGDKILFFINDNGEIVIQNPSVTALEEAQAAVADGVYTEDDVLADVMELRYGVAE